MNYPKQIILKLLRDSKLIFWDFDGVIKDSVATKADAFEALFVPFSTSLSKRVREHHEANGGISRYDKMPLYLKWAGEPASLTQVHDYCERFSAIVLEAVIASDWVPGVLDYLTLNCTNQEFVLLTATPQNEIDYILQALKIRNLFSDVFGSPKEKDNAMADVLENYRFKAIDALMIGDSSSDMIAARINKVPFVLRRTKLNISIQQNCGGLVIDNFCNE